MVTPHEGIGVSEPQAEAGLHRLLAACALVLLIIAWVKLVPTLGLGALTALVPLCAGLAILACLSPPIAAALFFLGNYFFGNLSIMFYPRVSFLAVLTAVLVGTLLFVRWKRGELVRFLNLPRRVWLAVAALALFFLIGYVRALWQMQMFEIVPEQTRSLFTLFQASLRANNELGHYMLIGHWLSFIAIGALACLSTSELRTFFVSFSVLFVVQLLSISFSYYPEFFRAIYTECQALGLGYGQVNRGYLGYMAALAGGLALTMAHEQGTLRRTLFLTWWVILSAFVFLSATKGPILAWVLVTIYVALKGRRIAKIPLGPLAGVLLSIGILSVAVGHSIVPCGMIKKAGEMRYSAETRIASIRDILVPYLKETAGAEDAVRYKAGETEPRRPNEGMRVKDGYQEQEIGWDTWLAGKGFGGATRLIDYENKTVYTRASTLNLPLDLFIETGLIGLALFIFAVTTFWLQFRKAVDGMTPAKGHLLLLATSSMLLVVLVKISIAAETHTEDIMALMIGLLIGTVVKSKTSP